MALEEECCFYASKSGVIMQTMYKIWDGLLHRQKECEASQGWFEYWFSLSPWLTTLVTRLMGSTIIILLLLMFRPCIINMLVQFTKQRLGAMQFIVQ